MRRPDSLPILAILLLLVSPALADAPYKPPEGWKTIVRGSPMHGSNGIFFDAADRLHIASVFGREIAIVDPRTGEFLDRIGPSRGVEGPDDLYIREDGTIYMTSIITGEVIRLAPDGTTTRQFVARGVNPITFSEEGRLFVALDFLGDGLYEVDPDLEDPPRRIIAGGLGYLNGMDWGDDGYLYGPIFSGQKVVRIDVDSCDEATEPYVECDIEVVADGFAIPAAVKFNSRGELHVIDQAGYAYRVDIETGEKTLIANLPTGLDNLAFDSKDRLFVSNANSGGVAEVLSSGRMREILRAGAIAPAGIIAAAGTEREVEGRTADDVLYVADLWTTRAYDAKTGRAVEIVEKILEGLRNQNTVAERGGELILSSWGDNTVRRIDKATHGTVWVDHGFAIPLNAVPFGDDLLVAELGTRRIVRASDHTVVAEGFYYPLGMASNGDDAWVADWATGVIWKIAEAGSALADKRPVAFGLSLPEGLAVDGDGGLLVLETGTGELSRIDPLTGAVTVVASGFPPGLSAVPGTPPSNFLNGVAVGEDGAIYVTSDLHNEVYKLPAGR